MKKLLAVALAVVMVLSMSVMAFAATQTDYPPSSVEGAQSGTTIQTSLYDEEGNPVAGGFTVTIPATVTIPWGGTSAENGGDTFTWSYSAQLAENERLTLSIDKTSGVFYDGAEGDLTYALSGTGIDAAYTTASEVDAGTLTATVTTAGWNFAPIAEYSDTVTFTASVD